MKAALIMNPVAGQGRPLRVLPKVEENLRAHFDLQILKTQKQGDGFVLAEEALGAGCEAVIVLGGDGTISEVVNALARGSAPVGILPCGTANILARELCIPNKIQQACSIITEGNTEQIDLGRAGDNYFALMAGVGFDAEVVEDVNADVKRMLKDLAYVLSGVKVLLKYKPTEMLVRVDGEEPRLGYFTVVGNAKYYAGRFSITSKASIQDGLLDICIFKQRGIDCFARYIGGVIAGKHMGFKDVEYLRGNTVEIEAERPTLVQADGEVIGRLPMQFSVAPKAISVFRPAR